MQQIRTLTKLLALSVCTALLLSVSGCGESKYISGSSQQTAPPVTQKTATALKATVDDYMTSDGTPAGVPGTIVAVKLNGYQPWYYASGSAEINVADNSQVRAMKAEMPFRIASITKMFIAQTVIKLAEEGKIDLNKSVEFYLPGALTGKNLANKDTITINMLLNHTSGLYSYVTSDAGLLNGNDPTAVLPMNNFVKRLGQTTWTHASWKDPLNITSTDDVLNFVNTFSPPTSITVTPLLNGITSIGDPYKTNPYFAPGADFHYSNTNYYLLGLLIEKVSSSHDVAAEIKRLITDPLGLSDTYLPTAKSFSNPVHVHGYSDYFNDTTYSSPVADSLLKFHKNQANTSWVNGDGKLEDFTEIDPSFPWTTGGMISSAKDLLTFTEFIMNSRVKSGQERGNWIIGSPLDISVSFQYGRGIARVKDSMFGHGGQFAGYNIASYWFEPSDVYIVVMTNKYSFVEEDPNNLLRSIVAGADTLYKQVAKTTDSKADPNTAIINRLLAVLEQDPGVAKKLKKSGDASLSFPDVSSWMR
ncbi:MAG: serine hydrolase [Desulfuromonadaceae bacterium]|nr:serine hydrolase [Desulfuromonadaceae bacterium]